MPAVEPHQEIELLGWLDPPSDTKKKRAIRKRREVRDMKKRGIKKYTCTAMRAVDA